MLDRFLDWLRSRGSSRMITRDGEPYLERFYLFKTKYLTIMIHKFWNNDPDECHDHPFDWASLVLRGCLKEIGVDGEFGIRWAGDFRYRRAEEFHHLEIPKEEADALGQPITLFFTGRRRREWGFLRGEKWINASEYDRQAVEIQGRDFVVEGIFFPKVRKLHPPLTPENIKKAMEEAFTRILAPPILWRSTITTTTKFTPKKKTPRKKKTTTKKGKK